MNVRLYDGTVRCADHFDAASYESETTDPCLYCERTASESDEAWLEAQSALVVAPPTRTLRLGKTRPCDRCWEPATWKIVDGLSLDFLCTGHGQEWHPDLFPEFTITCGTCESVTPTPGPWNVHVTWCDDCVSHGRHLTSH